MATANLGADIKSAKISLRVCRSQVTKAIKEFEHSGAELNKAKEGSKAKKLRLAARMLENLDELQKKVKKMETANENTIEILLSLEDEELSKSKEDLVKEYEAENNKYLNESKDIQGQLEELIEKAEEIMAGTGQEPVLNQDRQATAAGGESAVAAAAPTTNNDFRPHMNLKPNYL